MATRSKRCSICGKFLSETNPGDHCRHHDIDEGDLKPSCISLCTSRETTGFDRAQFDYHGNFGLGINHNFER